jgi:hypothetical protein
MNDCIIVEVAMYLQAVSPMCMLHITDMLHVRCAKHVRVHLWLDGGVVSMIYYGSHDKCDGSL